MELTTTNTEIAAATPIEALSSNEAYELHGHEQVIQDGLATFQAVGSALIAIRDKRLYRGTHGTFEAYTQDKWGITRRRADQLIEAASVVENLGTNGSQILPGNERQARELAAVAPDLQQTAWNLVLETAPDKKVTANHIAIVAQVLGEMHETGAIDPGDGIEIAESEVLKAAITEETYERMKRQQEYINQNRQKRKETRAAAATQHTASPSDGEPPAGVAKYELYTPEWLILKARQALGGEIDLDPASCKEAQTVVQANRFFDIEHDGLKQPWVTTALWLNHPYGDTLNQPWAEKLLSEWNGGGMMKGLALMPASVGSKWFQLLADFPRCHLSQRVTFWGPADKGDGPRFDSVVFAFGIPLDTFAEAFEDVGHIYVRYQRGRNGNHT